MAAVQLSCLHASSPFAWDVLLRKLGIGKAAAEPYFLEEPELAEEPGVLVQVQAQELVAAVVPGIAVVLEA